MILRRKDDLPVGEDDQNVSRAIDAISKAQSSNEAAKLTASALKVMWRVLAQYARANKERLDHNRAVADENVRQLRRLLIGIGVGMILLGGAMTWITIHVQDVHHADTRNTLEQVKAGEQATVNRAFYLSALASCQRLNARAKTAKRNLKVDEQTHPAAAAEAGEIAGPLISALAPTHRNCAAYATDTVRKEELPPPKHPPTITTSTVP